MLQSLLIMFKTTALLLILFAITACNKPTPAEGDWIKGSPQEQLEIIETQFRGMDKAMVEVGYRYQELYWSGQDQNWPYADYQLKKIEKGTRLGLERRPKRAKSVQHFLNNALPNMAKAIEMKDTTLFNQNFEALRVSCNSCHVMEGFPTFVIGVPKNRQSCIGNQEGN